MSVLCVVLHCTGLTLAAVEALSLILVDGCKGSDALTRLRCFWRLAMGMAKVEGADAGFQQTVQSIQDRVPVSNKYIAGKHRPQLMISHAIN